MSQILFCFVFQKPLKYFQIMGCFEAVTVAARILWAVYQLLGTRFAKAGMDNFLNSQTLICQFRGYQPKLAWWRLFDVARLCTCAVNI
jgi:hypothetical protein